MSSVIIPSSVETIESEAFRGCSKVTSIVIPNSVTSIGQSAFGSVKNIIYHGDAIGSPWGASHINGSIDGDFIFNDESKTILYAYIGNEQNVTIPNSVTVIGDGAFYACGKLSSVIIPNGVTSIGKDVFRECYSLTNIAIPASVTSIGEYAFYLCQSAQVTIPDNVTSIANEAFGHVKHIVYHGEATGSPWGAYHINGFIDGDFVYEDDTKTKLYVYVGNNESVSIPDGVTTIEKYAFYSSINLKSVIIPNGVNSIDNYAFDECYGLESITIPDGLTNIGRGAFAYCINLSNLISKSPVAPTLADDNVFYDVDLLHDIHIPEGATASYQEKWGANFNYIEDATPINEIYIDNTRPAFDGIYNLQGQKLTAPQRGINIINGKKVVVKF